jgi:hypothetical protein
MSEVPSLLVHCRRRHARDRQRIGMLELRDERWNVLRYDIVRGHCVEQPRAMVASGSEGVMPGNVWRSAAARQIWCGRTGDRRQHGDRLPRTASRCQRQRFVGHPRPLTSPFARPTWLATERR